MKVEVSLWQTRMGIRLLSTARFGALDFDGGHDNSSANAVHFSLYNRHNEDLVYVRGAELLLRLADGAQIVRRYVRNVPWSLVWW